ncbi:unnamed protein product [Linum tenue]|uniref:GOLD domain-containing protein n=1 Tax=Linum tenue TaxID=586396 RepID=A0AAV0LBH8_9ROSI|nr:unnamed protein product [Linum tenue]
MASTEGLVPITRKFLASYYDKYPFPPLSDDVSRLCSEIRSIIPDLLKESPPSSESSLVDEAGCQPPRKVDENMWKNREQLEEILFLLEKSRWPRALQQPSTSDDSEIAIAFVSIHDKVQKTLKMLEAFQSKNSERVLNIVMTYLPQDFRATLILQQRERSERNKKAAVDALVSSGGTIREKYALLWQQQVDRRRQLAQLGSATGVYKTLVKYLVGVPEVLLDFVRQINDDDGPMEEQRHRYGPPLYSLTTMILLVRVFVLLSCRRFDAGLVKRHHITVLEQAVDVYSNEFIRFITFLRYCCFLDISLILFVLLVYCFRCRNNDDFKEISVAAGSSHEVLLSVESINSYIAWDFSLIQGKMSLDIGFSVEYINPSGQKTLILPYRRCESDQGNFCTVMTGDYKLVWDNSYSSFFKKVVRCKVDCIPPVVEPAESRSEVEG